VTLLSSVALFTAVLGVDPAAAATPTWPSGLYAGLLQNVPFTIPIAVTGGAPLTSMTVNTAPASTTGFGLANVNLATGTADMVGTYTAAANGSTVTAKINATNASGTATLSYTLEAYTCSWTSSAGSTTSLFDANQAAYVTGSQSGYGAAITNGVTAGTTTLNPTCANLRVPGTGAAVLTLSNPFSGVITPSNNDNGSAESNMGAGCGIVSIFGTNTGNFAGSNCNGSRTVPATWANGGTLSLSIGTQSDVGDTNLALTGCPPSQAAVNAGLVTCNITGSTGSPSLSWNFTNDQFLYNGQNLPQTTTATLSSNFVGAGDTVSVTGGSNWWGNAAGAPVAGTGHTQSGSYYSVPAPGVFIGTSRGTAIPATSPNVQVSGVTYACGQASSSVPPNPCTFTPGQISGSFTVPASLTPGSYNVYIDEPNTSPLMGNGPNDSYQTARGTNRGSVESVTAITIGSAPSITSAASTTFTKGSAGNFTVTSTGTPTAALSKTGALPSGVTFTDNGNGTATLAGTPTVGGTFPITITASNGVGTNANQSFTLTVNSPPTITSAASATFTVGTAQSFLVTTTGQPAPSLSKTGALPSGVTFTDNGNGTATIGGTPAAGTAGSYPITITASNGFGSDANQSFTLSVNQAPAITSAASTTFTVGSAGSFNVTTTGVPASSVSKTGALPTGVTFTDNGNGTATLAGTPAAGTGGSYPLTITASNGVLPNAQQSFTLTVNQAPAITSAAATMFTAGSSGSFPITTTGTPAPALSETGSLPSGVTFTDDGNGTATLAGTPAAGTGGSYPITINASNGVGAVAHQSFTLTVNQAPTITSAASTTFTVASAGGFAVTTTGNPAPALSATGTLPGGVVFVDNGNGTATLTGTPAAGSGGTYSITINASNGIGADAHQSFTLTVNEAPTVTSAASTTFTVGSAGSFAVTSTGFPTPALSRTGTLPGGVTFTDNGNGTATLTGTPAAGTGGSYPITINATNGVGPVAHQSFTLTVNQAPAITSAASTTFTVGSAGTFTVITTGYPNAALSETGSVPSGVTFLDNTNGTAKLSGIPAAGTGGVYPITINATNGVGPVVHQSFTLTVNQSPGITSAASTTFTIGTNGTFTVTTSGFPAPAVAKTGTLPSGVTFTDNGNGTATIGGTPAVGTAGNYPITITASNGVGSPANQSFTLQVSNQPIAPTITSTNNTAFTVGSAGTFTITTTGFPAPTLTKTGALPSGVTFTDNGNGSATLAGTPAAGTAGSYPLTITATNGVGSPANQSFTLTVNQVPAITSGASATFTVGTAQSFVVTSTGSPTPALSKTGALPSGVTFTDNVNGTATIGGTPAAGTAGSYPITITASNGVGSPANQSFTLTVNSAPAITSAPATTFTVGSAGSFSITSAANPTAALSETGSLPSGVTFTDNGNGTATLAGTPAAGTGGTYPLTINASNGIGADAHQSFTLTVNQAPAVTSAASTTFTVGSAGSFAVTSTGFPTPALSRTGTLPSGVTFTDNGNGTASLSGTPAGGTGGSYPITINATNGVGPVVHQSFTLTVNQGAAITSAASASFTVGSPGTFTVTSTGNPLAALSETGPLPSGVTFLDNTNGTAKLSGTPAAGTGGVYPITINATNGIGSPANQSFTLTVNQAPAITSAASTTLTEAANGSFAVTTTGFPDAAVTKTGALPSGVTFTDNGDGTATLGGTPAVGTAGDYPITITASNGVAPDAQQSFVLHVGNQPVAPAITSAASTTFQEGVAGTFTVTTTGFPAAAVSQTGALPSGITFTDNGDGTASLAGTAAAGTAGNHGLTLTASNSVAPDANQLFTLTVVASPVITSGNSITVVEGSPVSFTIATTGFPSPGISETGALPTGVTFTDNGNGTATLSGVPPTGTAGTYPLSLTASNSVAPDATQSFTLTVQSNVGGSTISIGDASLVEGNSGALAGSSGVATLVFPITLSQPLLTENVTANVQLQGVTAVGAKKPGPGVDFNDKGGFIATVTFKPGVIERKLGVRVYLYGDTTLLTNKTFTATLTNPSAGYSIGRGVGIGTIIANPPPAIPHVDIGDASVMEGNSGKLRSVILRVTLSQPVGSDVTMHYLVEDVSATYGKKPTVVDSDYGKPATNLLTIRAGHQFASVNLRVYPDTRTGEGPETVKVTLLDVSGTPGVGIGRSVATMTILDDD
jgi:hypothetical protein